MMEGLEYLVLYGKTGCGKSAILTCLKEKGEQVLHLEEMAAHSGSAFGGLGKEEQPEQEAFEQQIADTLASFNTDRPVWLEYESTYLGKLILPHTVVESINNGKVIVIDLDYTLRVQRILAEYASLDQQDLLDGVRKIKNKLSHKKYRLTRKCIRQGDFQTAIAVVLTYYDRIYENGLKRLSGSASEALNLKGFHPEDHADQILDFCLATP